MAVVMCLSTDDTLSQTRRMILENAGHSVHLVRNVPEARRVCAENPVTVVVIGQGVPRIERVRVFDLVRKECPEAKVLELYRPADGKALNAADAWLEVPVSVPPVLADKVGELAKS